MDLSKDCIETKEPQRIYSPGQVSELCIDGIAKIAGQKHSIGFPINPMSKTLEQDFIDAAQKIYRSWIMTLNTGKEE